MKLFDLSPKERHDVQRFLIWHFGYVGYVCLFAFLIYHFHLFKAYWFLKEFWILNLVAPAHTVLFITLSPYKQHWFNAIKNMYTALDGDPVFCIMGFLLMAVGFYLYNAVLWGLGSLIPSIFFT